MENKVGVVKSGDRREWSSKLMGCCNDGAGKCLYAWFCFPCFACNLSKRLDESCWGPWLCGAAFIAGLRNKIRLVNGIEGTMMDDFTKTCFCALCVALQMERELDKIQGGPQQIDRD